VIFYFQKTKMKTKKKIIIKKTCPDFTPFSSSSLSLQLRLQLLHLGPSMRSNEFLFPFNSFIKKHGEEKKMNQIITKEPRWFFSCCCWIEAQEKEPVFLWKRQDMKRESGLRMAAMVTTRGVAMEWWLVGWLVGWLERSFFLRLQDDSSMG